MEDLPHNAAVFSADFAGSPEGAVWIQKPGREFRDRGRPQRSKDALHTLESVVLDPNNISQGVIVEPSRTL